MQCSGMGVKPMSNNRIPLDDLNITGLEEYPENESVLLHGPPGTGKTTTAAGRVALLLRDHGYTIDQVAWATYRRSLADDTLARLAEWGVIDEHQLDDPTKGPTRYISTIHAIANRAVGGLPQPIESWHKRAFCKELDIRYSTSEPWEKSPGKELFRCFEWMANNCYNPGDPADLDQYPHLGTLRELFPGDVADVWGAWGRYKDNRDRIDFHEMLEAAIQERAVPPADILVVDEYHDATPLMARVAELWMDAADIVIVAGDPHQVVNQYDGASPWFFERLENRYPKILLDKSYRVGRRHWRPATRVLSTAHDPPGVEPTGTGEIHEYRSPSFRYSSESGWTTPDETTPGSPAAIATQYGDGGDLMFLTRTRMQADAIGATLENAGVLYRSQKKLGGWNTARGETRHALYNALQKIRGVSPRGFEGHAGGGLNRFATDDGSKSPENIYLASKEAVELLRHANAKHLDQSRGETEKLCDEIDAKE